MRFGRIALVCLGVLLALIVRADAETNAVRLSKQYGLPYLPMLIIEDQKLIEKQARAAGLGEVAVTWSTRRWRGGTFPGATLSANELAAPILGRNRVKSSVSSTT